MPLLDDLRQISEANRVIDIERRQSNAGIEGDFEGSVTAHWVRYDSQGSGIVTYNNKQYVTKPLGNHSIPAGTEVELSHADGIYYSKF